MTVDEWVRAFCYFLMFPAFIYFALIAWNRRQRLVASSYFALAAFFLLLLVGLVLGHYHRPIPVLLQVNTGVVVVLCTLVTWRATTTMMTALLAAHVESVVLREAEYE